MATKLYVGNLSFRVTDDDLFSYFAQAGSVESASVITDRETGRSRGFGFVEMANDNDATNAIELFNGKELDGRNLTVNEARPRENGGGGHRSSGPRSDYGGGRGGGGGGRSSGGRGGSGGGRGGSGGGRGGGYDREPRW